MKNMYEWRNSEKLLSLKPKVATEIRDNIYKKPVNIDFFKDPWKFFYN